MCNRLRSASARTLDCRFRGDRVWIFRRHIVGPDRELFINTLDVRRVSAGGRVNNNSKPSSRARGSFVIISTLSKGATPRGTLFDLSSRPLLSRSHAACALRNLPHHHHYYYSWRVRESEVNRPAACVPCCVFRMALRIT